MFYFFFQAEDGIRDADVTGVHTCALPISTAWPAESRWSVPSVRRRFVSANSRSRSEERRVGKECRFRWATVSQKKEGNVLNFALRPVIGRHGRSDIVGDSDSCYC